MVFYNSRGNAIAYLDDDGETIYLFSGEPVAYLPGDNTIYGFNGKHFGWFEDGWIRDLDGCCVFFTEGATGSGPMKPMKHIKPMKHMQRMKPIKHMRHMKKMKHMNTLSWSRLSGIEFFAQ